MLLSFITILIVSLGLLSTFTPRLPGTLIILAGGSVYGMFTGFETFKLWIVISLVSLFFMADIGSRILRMHYNQGEQDSISFSTNITAGNIAGLVVADALFGSAFGMLIWGIIAGKTFLPRFDYIADLLVKLVGLALLRFICGLIMVIIIVDYVIL